MSICLATELAQLPTPRPRPTSQQLSIYDALEDE